MSKKYKIKNNTVFISPETLREVHNNVCELRWDDEENIDTEDIFEYLSNVLFILGIEDDE